MKLPHTLLTTVAMLLAACSSNVTSEIAPVISNKDTLDDLDKSLAAAPYTQYATVKPHEREALALFTTLSPYNIVRIIEGLAPIRMLPNPCTAEEEEYSDPDHPILRFQHISDRIAIVEYLIMGCKKCFSSEDYEMIERSLLNEERLTKIIAHEGDPYVKAKIGDFLGWLGEWQLEQPCEDQ